ncbi:hypothetical protein [Streptomyces olivaceoviridis]|uniref:hypothetical protein n=1 Tax=Streptomyces olivaceoviridis TaxID=1921 RepID=UPI0036A55EBB
MRARPRALRLVRLERCGYLEQRALPRSFHTDVVRARLEEIERHGRRRTQPYAREVEPTHGVHPCQMERGGRHAVSD